jgi:hypothetical protein
MLKSSLTMAVEWEMWWAVWDEYIMDSFFVELMG